MACRNVVGFARRITRDVLTNRRGLCGRSCPRATACVFPGWSSREHEIAPEPPDWDLLHLAHVEQVSPPGQVWASVIEVLRSQVPRPAFETWLSESRGSAYVDGQFVVSTPSLFAAEMLEARLHPLIERVVRDAVGAELDIQLHGHRSGRRALPALSGAGHAGRGFLRDMHSNLSSRAIWTFIHTVWIPTGHFHAASEAKKIRAEEQHVQQERQ